MSLFQIIIVILAIWVGWKILKRISTQLGDDPNEALTDDEKKNAAMNENGELK